MLVPEEIQERLDRYCDLFPDEETQDDVNDVNIPTIDIFKEVASLRDSLTDKNVDLCFCERENVCNCKSQDVCSCDNEDFYTVSEVEIIDGSNSNIIFEFLMMENVSISRLKNVRFFSLDKRTDEETWIMDLLKTIEKRKKKKVVSKYFLKTHSHNDNSYIEYEIFDTPHLNGKRMQIKIDYLQYSQI